MASKGLLELNAVPKRPRWPFNALFCVQGLGSLGWCFKAAEPSFKIHHGEDKSTSKETISRGSENVSNFGKSPEKLLIGKQILNTALSTGIQEHVTV